MSVYSGLSMQQIPEKIFYILLLMALFHHNAPSNFVNLASGKTGIGYRNA